MNDIPGTRHVNAVDKFDCHEGTPTGSGRAAGTENGEVHPFSGVSVSANSKGAIVAARVEMMMGRFQLGPPSPRFFISVHSEGS